VNLRKSGRQLRKSNKELSFACRSQGLRAGKLKVKVSKMIKKNSSIDI
jgi:hypothetical protein